MPALSLVVAIAVGYLIGAFPSGVVIGRLAGRDPRDEVDRAFFRVQGDTSPTPRGWQ